MITAQQQAPLAVQGLTSRMAVIALVGLLLILFSVTMLPPLGVSLIYRDGGTDAFLDTFLITLTLGIVLRLPIRRKNAIDLKKRQGFLVVVATWIAASLLSAVPFMLARPHMHFTDAVFESVSGLTTTGATVLTGLESLPHSILYYRAQLNFIAGIGIVVLAVAILPMFGIGGMQLYRAETPGPMKDEKLTPRIRETAKRLWYVYVGLVIACVLSFWAAGMNLFDAIAHGFATLALGGFSTHTDSIGYFHSAAIEIVAGVFSLLAGVNYTLYYMVWRNRSFKTMLQNAELKFYLGVMGAVILATCLSLWLTGTYSPWKAFYHGFFQTASIATDNGLVSGGYPAWPAFIPLLLIFASFFGGCVGSTCGGIKAFRFLLLFRQSMREVRLLIHPSAQFALKVGDSLVSDRVVTAVWGFFFLYIFAYCFFSLGVAMTGVDLVTAFGSVAACLNNMGAGIGQTATQFGSLNEAAKWLLSCSMLIGRLEVFPFLVLFSPDFWR
ncbi:MAG TPA: TrkH family potassium uptake protein [Gammaproteobacteria bacterium]|nr:TrkH family potassium uptake protein [Gammaproteobacteria bacterium]